MANRLQRKKCLVLILCLLPLCFGGCDSKGQEQALELETILIQGRDEGAWPAERPDVYRMKMPAGWTYIKPSNDTSNQDSRTPIAEFLIIEGNDEIRITIHNFPPQKLGQRIPPLAQISRWKGQLTALDHSRSLVAPESFSGFTGLRFEGIGLINGQKTAVIAWAMQLGSEHFSTLGYPHDHIESALLKQMQADVTIKASGPPKSIEKHKEAILRFAGSFELIHEIPTALP